MACPVRLPAYSRGMRAAGFVLRPLFWYNRDMDDALSPLIKCELCPRRCKAARKRDRKGYCGIGNEIIVAHYGPHFGEEPPISGERGSGNIFFGACNLKCIYCQNYQISQQHDGTRYDVAGLVKIFFSLQEQGVHNINLVSPTPYIPFIAAAIRAAKEKGFTLPFVYNSNAYENVEALALLRGLVDIYLPDFKYGNPKMGRLLSDAHEYPKWAKSAILEMKAQVGNLVIQEGIARKGLLVRHLVLPNNLAGSKEVITWIRDNLGPDTYLSLMAQYCPLHKASTYPMLDRKITKEEYRALLDLLSEYGFRNVFIQDLDSASLFVPDFKKDRPFEQRTGTKG
jgi:putative pyruvate formate lyase activating enzyme